MNLELSDAEVEVLKRALQGWVEDCDLLATSELSHTFLSEKDRGEWVSSGEVANSLLHRLETP